MKPADTTVNTWISRNASTLRHSLDIHFPVDKDAFQDAYLSLVDEFKAPTSGDTLEAAFVKAYKDLTTKNLRTGYGITHPDDFFFNLLPSEANCGDESEKGSDYGPLAKKVRRHIRTAFPRIEVMAFEMRLKGFSCRDITDTLGLGVTAINSATERIITQTRLHFADESL